MRLITSYFSPFCYMQCVDVLEEDGTKAETFNCNTENFAETIANACSHFRCGDVRLFGPTEYLAPICQEVYSLANSKYDVNYINIEVN